MLCPVSAVGCRSVTLGPKRSPRGSWLRCSGFLSTPLRWSPLFAFSALAFAGSHSCKVRTQPRIGLPDAQKLSTGANGRTRRDYAQWGVCGLESASMQRHCQRWCLHRSLRSVPAVWGFGLCTAPKACGHRTPRAHLCNMPVARDKRQLSEATQKSTVINSCKYWQKFSFFLFRPGSEQ